MHIEIDFTMQGTYINGRRQKSSRAAQFLLALVYFCDTQEGQLTSSQLAGLIITGNHRTVLNRIMDSIEHKLGIAGYVVYDNRTTGPWRVNRESGHSVAFKFRHDDATIEKIASEIFKRPQSGFFDTLARGIETTSQALPDEAFLIARGDAQFNSGDIAAAEREFRRALSSASRRNDAILVAISSQRLLQVYRRSEDYANIVKLRNRLRMLASKMTSGIVRAFLRDASELFYVWYLYSAKKDYASAKTTLHTINLTNLQIPSLRIEWLNLDGLILRREILEILDADPGASVSDLVQNSLNSLRAALHEAILFGVPYNLQQVSANLANVMALYLRRVPGAIRGEKAASTDIIRLIGFSSYAARIFGLGKDDMYNAIYLLSFGRHFAWSLSDMEKVWQTGPVPLAAAEVLGFDSPRKSLSDYGDAEFVRSGLGNKSFGPEQQSYLAFEICWAAMTEKSFVTFEKYAVIFAERSCDAQGLVSPQARKSARLLLDHAAKMNRSNWIEAAAVLKLLL
jgi:hypothetical protein